MTLTAPELAPATRTVQGTRPGRWPTGITFGDLPVEGVDLTLRVPHRGPLTIVCQDQSYGLSAIPGFVPRPPCLEQSSGRDSDRVLVQRTYSF